MKKLLAVLLCVAMLFAFTACGGNDADTTDYKVAMITDYGDITDESFNQTTYEACKAFCEENDLEFNYFKPAGDNTADRVSMIDSAVSEGYNVIVMPGYAFGGAIVDAAPNYPDVKFIALDVAKGDLLEAAVAAKGEEYDYNPDNWDLAEYFDMSNVYCVVYQEELAGYMAGYAAVKLGYTDLGFLGGMAVPAVVRYGQGFVQGVDAAAVESGKDVNVKYVYGGQFQGDADITSVMDTWYKAGTEIVFACGGGIYTSAAEAAAKVDGKVIGVDSDQSGIIGEDITVTSAMKGLAPTVKTALDAIKDGSWESDYAGKIDNLGLISENPEDNYVQLPMETTQWDDNFTVDDYKDLVKKLYNGEIEVSSDITAMPETEITVNDYGSIK